MQCGANKLGKENKKRECPESYNLVKLNSFQLLYLYGLQIHLDSEINSE